MRDGEADRVDVVLAEGTGALGARIARALRTRDARVTAIVRPGTALDKLRPLADMGVSIVAIEAHSRPPRLP